MRECLKSVQVLGATLELAAEDLGRGSRGGERDDAAASGARGFGNRAHRGGLSSAGGADAGNQTSRVSGEGESEGKLAGVEGDLVALLERGDPGARAVRGQAVAGEVWAWSRSRCSASRRSWVVYRVEPCWTSVSSPLTRRRTWPSAGALGLA